MSKTCCVNGHRPSGFPWIYGKENQSQATYKKILCEIIDWYISENDVTDFISGMALGADMDFAATVLLLREKYPYIRLHCAIPCRDQTRLWKEPYISLYNNILRQADSSVILSESYTRTCMLERNRYMVDKSDYVFAVWNGERKGGTWYTMEYAKKLKRPVEVLRLDELI